VADSIHRPLYLTALAIQSDAAGSPLVFVDADLGFWRNKLRFQELRAAIQIKLSLEPERFLFGLSHTHSSVTLADPDSALPGGELLEPYLKRLQQAAEQAIQGAIQNAQEARLEWQYGRCALASNRDLPEPTPGSSRVICGFNPNARADDTLLVGRVTSQTGTVLAIITNYACHPTTLAWENTAISPDFVGAMRETIEAATGAPALFLQGASGDLAPRYQYVGDLAVADRHGRQLGYASLASLEDMDPPGTQLAFDRVVESGAPLAVWRYESIVPSTTLDAHEIVVELPVKDWPTAEKLERQRAACTDRALQERLRRKRDTRIALGDGATCSLPLWVWRLGDSIILGVPEEAYSKLQIELRRQFPDLYVACVNLVNNRIGGYLPSEELYDLDIYQVWRTPFARGSLEIVIAALAEAIGEMMAGRNENRSRGTQGSSQSRAH
jgi:hypothetical protein